MKILSISNLKTNKTYFANNQSQISAREIQTSKNAKENDSFLSSTASKVVTGTFVTLILALLVAEYIKYKKNPTITKL